MTENDAIIQIKKTKKSISGKSSQKMKWSDEMLTEERLQGIERIVKEKGSASIPELMERMGISESTARRDLTLLDKQEGSKKSWRCDDNQWMFIVPKKILYSRKKTGI